jgi:hypothetical protein
MKKNITKFLLLVIAFTFALSVNYLFAAWTGPTQAPPGGNTPAPVHVGLITQTKDGGLIVGALRSLLDVYVDGKVGIGTVSPTQKLDVIGGAKISEGLQVGNTTSANAGTIRWNGSDFEGYDGSKWVSFTIDTVGGGSVCPAGKTSVNFGGSSICLAEGVTASAVCQTQYSNGDGSSFWVTSEGQARYSNGKIQTMTNGGLNTGAYNCNSKWVDGNYAECIDGVGIKHTVTANINGIILSSDGVIPTDDNRVLKFSCYKIDAWK